MKFTKIFLTAALLAPSSIFAQDVTDIPEIGPHQRIFTVEKNVNPENLVEVYTKVDGQCRFVTNPANRDEPVFDFYWLIDRGSYKPMNSFFKNEFHKRMTFVSGGTSIRFQLEANDLKEVKHDLGSNPRFDVMAISSRTACDVRAFITLGPSDNNARIRLDTIYGEGRAFPPKVYAVTLKGEVVDENGKGSGKMISRRYLAN